MDSTSAISLLTVIGAVLIILLFIFIILSVRAAYHSGIRDGYQNSWLPSVKKQVREEDLHHGDEVEK